jgi:hypothetical protein
MESFDSKTVLMECFARKDPLHSSLAFSSKPLHRIASSHHYPRGQRFHCITVLITPCALLAPSQADQCSSSSSSSSSSPFSGLFLDSRIVEQSRIKNFPANPLLSIHSLFALHSLPMQPKNSPNACPYIHNLIDSHEPKTYPFCWKLCQKLGIDCIYMPVEFLRLKFRRSEVGWTESRHFSRTLNPAILDQF